MKTPCRIENVNKCSNESCGSMVLRSACSHGHSHVSLASDADVRTQNSDKKRISLKKSIGKEKTSTVDNSKKFFHLESLLETSLKQITHKSTRTISILKENLYKRLEFSENQKNEQNGRSLKSSSGQHIIKTSTPVSSSFVRNSFITSEDFFGDGHSSERIEATMSGRNLERRPLNAFSDSETEEESSNTKGRARSSITTRSSREAASRSIYSRSSRRNSSDHLNANNFAVSTSTVSTDKSIDPSWSSPNNNNVINRKNSSLNSSQMNRLLVQESKFDRLRWVVCRYIYLKIISLISFDVWLLSRLRGSKTVLLLLLLPLLMYLSYFAIIWSDFQPSFSFISSVPASCQRFTEAVQSSFLNIYSFLPCISTIYGFFPAVLKKSEEETPYISSSTQEQSYKLLSVSQEQLESLVVETLEKRIQLDKETRVSNTQDVKSDTARFQEEITDLRQQVKLLQQFQNNLKLERSSHTKDIERERQSADHEINLVNGKLKLLEDQLISFGNRQKIEKSSFSEDIGKLSAEHEIWNKKLKLLEDQLFSQKLDHADFIVSIEKHLVAAFRSIMNADKTSSYFFFSEWLNSNSNEIKIVIENLRKEQLEQGTSNTKVIEGLVRHYFESMKVSETFATTLKDEGMSDEHFRAIVRDAILLYDADKTGLADYALESAGGSVISIRCSESYTEKRGKFSLFGLPLWSDQNSPRIAIQPDVHPGRCWSFRGSQGFLVIQLSYPIRPTRFSLEHIPPSLSPTGSIDSAPKEFSVWGLASETDNEGTLLGRYTYEEKGHPLQYFTVENPPSFPISFVELKIHSNHGNLEYTCLYRFRVHGVQV